MAVPPGATAKPFPGCCRMVINSRCLPVLRTIKTSKTILPLQIAEGLLFSGDGDPSDATAFIQKVRRIDGDIREAITVAKKDQVGAIPYQSTRGICANAIFYWISQLADKSQNPKSVYSCYAEFIAGTGGAPF